jgi:2-amino-4-hydroxy-6-hydroxymethyldihydropteridine diphosphokinase
MQTEAIFIRSKNTCRVLKPRVKRFIATTQAKPFDKVYNFGGFSDGNRCVFVAKEFGAKSVKLAGFDFDDSGVNMIKKKEVKWVKELIGMSGI